MRTVELSDEIFERAERAAAQQGLPVAQLVERLVDRGVPSPPEPTGYRADFPLIKSDRPGTREITKEMIEAIELEDYLGRGGTSG